MSEFAIPLCAGCAHAVWPPRPVCARCGSSEWDETPVDHGVVTETVDSAGTTGEPVRLATVRLHLAPGATSDGPSGEGAGDGGGAVGPPAIARCEGCEVGNEVTLELRDGALLGVPK